MSAPPLFIHLERLIVAMRTFPATAPGLPGDGGQAVGRRRRRRRSGSTGRRLWPRSANPRTRWSTIKLLYANGHVAKGDRKQRQIRPPSRSAAQIEKIEKAAPLESASLGGQKRMPIGGQERKLIDNCQYIFREPGMPYATLASSCPFMRDVYGGRQHGGHDVLIKNPVAVCLRISYIADTTLRVMPKNEMNAAIRKKAVYRGTFSAAFSTHASVTHVGSAGNSGDRTQNLGDGFYSEVGRRVSATRIVGRGIAT